MSDYHIEYLYDKVVINILTGRESSKVLFDLQEDVEELYELRMNLKDDNFRGIISLNNHSYLYLNHVVTLCYTTDSGHPIISIELPKYVMVLIVDKIILTRRQFIIDTTV